MSATVKRDARDARDARNPLTLLFLLVFGGSCLLFWWLQSLLLTVWLGLNSSIEPRFLWISIGSLAIYTVAYLLPPIRLSGFISSGKTMDRCVAFSYRAILIWSVPAVLVALQFTAYRLTVAYGEGHGPSLVQQAILYVHLFLGLLFIGAIDEEHGSRNRLRLVIVLTILPRLLISLRWGRFFAAQAILPILFIAVARGWLKIGPKRVLQILLLGLFILFVPAITRGDTVFGEGEDGRPQIVNYFGYMNTLGFFQDYTDLHYTCQPLLVSLTAKIIPYHLLGACTIDVGDERGLPATLDVLLTKQYSDDFMAGTGGNYLLELYLLGGIPAIMGGTFIFALTCREFVEFLAHRSIFAGIWAECLSRALFAPRGNLGYVYERIPSLILATLAIVLLSWSFAKMNQPATAARAGVHAAH